MLFSNDHRENVTAAVIAHDKVTCAPHRMGYTGVEGVGGPMSRVQPYGLCNPPPCLPRHQVLACKGERGSDGSLPPYAGPLAGLWRGERDEAGRGPLKHTPKVLFMSMLNLTDNVHSQARRKTTGQTTDMWVRWVQMHLAHKSKLYILHKMLSLFQEILLLNQCKI